MKKKELLDIYNEFEPIAMYYVEKEDLNLLHPLKYSFKLFKYSIDRFEYEIQERLAHTKLLNGLKSLLDYAEEEDLKEDIKKQIRRLEDES
ncbi:MAG: hypothetical protein ACOCRO_05730 [Halanaerobiales bacterium]